MSASKEPLEDDEKKLMDLIDSYNEAVISLHIGMTGAAQEKLASKKAQRLLIGAETAMANLRNTIQRFGCGESGPPRRAGS